MRAWIRNAVSCFVVAVVVLAGAPAFAHGGGDDEDSAEHAAEDMAGVSISTIKALTRGSARAAGYAGTAAAADAAAPASAGTGGDPSVVGRWDPTVYETPVVPVFSAVLPDGKVLMWDSVGDKGVEQYPDQSYTRAAVWDPTTNTSKDVRLQGFNIFCAGFVQLANGDVLVAGGNKDQTQAGLDTLHVFHWRTETWELLPDRMTSPRWYPSVAALGDGDALIAAGQEPLTTPDPDTTDRSPELYDYATRTVDPLGFDSFSAREYPFLVPRTDGKVQEVGPEQNTFRYDLDAQTNTNTGPREKAFLYRNYGSFATFLPDKTLVSGGGTHHTPQEVNSNSSSVVVDTSSSGPTTPTSLTGSMSVGRRQHTLTILPDGSVLATGGMNSATEVQVDLHAAVLAAERWNPATGLWTTLASAQRIREYHSSAVLLPDGRVMSGGGGICTACVAAGYFEQNVEYFSPPSLYSDSCTPAVRPGLTGVPNQMGDGAPFSFTSSSAGDITKLGIIRLSADTHGVNQGQRYVPLSFTRSDTTITATGPVDGNTAPPGYYLMFAVTAAGVPSPGAIVHVGSVGVPDPGAAPIFGTPSDSLCPAPGAPTAKPTTAPAATTATTAGPTRCLEIRSTRGRTSGVVRWSCTTGADQAWRLRKKDATLRAAGRCLSFSSLSKGAKVQATRCSGGRLQKIVLRAKTIRPAAAPELCVTSAHAGERLGDRLVLQPCDGKRGSGRQRWTI